MKNYNKKLLITALLTLFASPVAFAGDDAGGSGKGEGEHLNGAKVGDTQTATITVPEVSLIDVTNTVSAILSPPKDAGDNFKFVKVKEDLNYAISTNISAANPKATKKIVATSTNIPLGWKFYITMGAPKASGISKGRLSLTSGTTSVDTVTGIKNVANHGLALTVEVGPEADHIMPSYTVEDGKAVTIVYTITADK